MSDSEEKPAKQPRRAIYLLPNLFTTSALFAGFYGVISAMDGNFSRAAIAIFIAMILDTLDGRVARLTNTSSDFGAEFDSLSDVISFGVAPGLIVYEWSLQSLGGLGFGQLGLLASFLYAACTALRLARFNTQLGIADKRFFQGLASPSGAALVMGMIWVADDVGYQGEQLALLAFVVTIAAGLLMVSNFTYYSFKDIGTHKRVSFMALTALVLLFAFTSIDPPKIVLACFAIYAVSGPAFSIWRWSRKREARQSS
ncbi:MAG: CDP-diacylglycerol--serine O-phosphatidyltransferase [Pseudomonadota bacterium]